jgi:peroxiredoxin
LRDQLNQLTTLNAEVLAVDPHEIWSAKYLLKEGGLSTDDLSYPMLTDPSLTVSAAYGVAFQMRIHVELSNRPATFVIDQAGTLHHERRATTFADRPSPEQLIKLLQDL